MIKLLFTGGLLLLFSSLLTNCSQTTNKKASAVATHQTVVIKGMKFIPGTVSLNKGDTLTFINKDFVSHNATEITYKWNSPDLAQGESWSFVPEENGDYFCTLHVVMKGEIIVKP